MDKFVAKTPWGKLVQLKGLEYLLGSFMQDIENQNRLIKKLQDEVKRLKHLEMSVNETKDTSILTRRAVKRLISKFETEENHKEKLNLIKTEFPGLKQSVDQLAKEMNSVKNRQDKISSELKIIAERQDKHARRIDAIFDSLVLLMDKIDRIQSKSGDSTSLDNVIKDALEEEKDSSK